MNRRRRCSFVSALSSPEDVVSKADLTREAEAEVVETAGTTKAVAMAVSPVEVVVVVVVGVVVAVVGAGRRRLKHDRVSMNTVETMFHKYRILPNKRPPPNKRPRTYS